ncbi:MAG: Cof-type HAD-IIB family hydrolase [Caldicoprobacterales bacterium]|nr:HAD family phosphatase [Clostridiales bacterium]
MNYRLIAIDLDDSLLGNDLKISEANRKALFAARKKGVHITIATGRMLDSALPYIHELNISIPVITYQGAYLKDTQTGDTLIKKSVPMDYTQKIIEECKKQNLHLQVYNESTYFFEKENYYSRLYHKATGIQGEEAKDLIGVLQEEPIKLIIIDEQQKIARLSQYFEEQFGDVLQVLISKPIYLEFTNKEATKGNALAKLGEMLEIPREEIIAIGDSYNDISMIEYAGLGIAMGNAPDHVKSYAQYVTKGNDESGIADAIRRFILNKE